MQEEVAQEVNEIASHFHLKPEQVDVLDVTSIKQDHNWKHYGLTHICDGAGHPRHVATSRE